MQFPYVAPVSRCNHVSALRKCWRVKQKQRMIYFAVATTTKSSYFTDIHGVSLSSNSCLGQARTLCERIKNVCENENGTLSPPKYHQFLDACTWKRERESKRSDRDRKQNNNNCCWRKYVQRLSLRRRALDSLQFTWRITIYHGECPDSSVILDLRPNSASYLPAYFLSQVLFRG